MPCRPMSKKKRHSLIDILRRPKQIDDNITNENIKSNIDEIVVV